MTLRRQLDRVLHILRLSYTRSPPRLERMIAVAQPLHTDCWSKSIASNLFRSPERISFPLDDQRWCGDRPEVLDAGALRVAGRMKRVAEADQPGGVHFVRHHACHPSSKRFAADEGPLDAGSPDRIAPRLEQDRLPVRRS